eukprot:scaffold2017_cov387-Prasinococcus_capsulatus_cf.AAC.5
MAKALLKSMLACARCAMELRTAVAPTGFLATGLIAAATAVDGLAFCCTPLSGARKFHSSSSSALSSLLRGPVLAPRFSSPPSATKSRTRASCSCGLGTDAIFETGAVAFWPLPPSSYPKPATEVVVACLFVVASLSGEMFAGGSCTLSSPSTESPLLGTGLASPSAGVGEETAPITVPACFLL